MQEYECCCSDCTGEASNTAVAAPRPRSSRGNQQAIPARTISAVDCCDKSPGTRTATTILSCVRPEAGAQDKQAHRGSTESLHSEARGLAAFADVFAAAAQRKSHSASRRSFEKRRNSHSALSSLLHQFTGALPRGRKRARGPSADAIDATTARAALQATVITGASRTAADEP